MACASCSSALPDGARFCPSCGAPVGSGRSEERRIVSVVFADVVGYTSLAEFRDPEQVKRIIDSCFERLVGDVQAFGGTVDKILGDGIIALFGAPVAHEDDAERAVRAALRMQETVRAYRIGPDGPLRMRIGVTTGEVLVGALRAGGDYTAMGDVVNSAARLQANAPAGRVLVGAPTHALTDRAIGYETFGEVEIRGREQRIVAYLATQPIAPPGGHRHRNHAPFVGRDEELGLIGGGLDLAFGRSRAFLIAIEGEGGVGKSRLVEEVACRARESHGTNVQIVEGSCAPYGQSSVWSPMASALGAILRLDSGATPDEARSTISRHLTAVLERAADDPESSRVAEAYLHILGFPSALDAHDPARVLDEVGRALQTALQAIVRRAPVIITITDIHWADPVIMQLFAHLLARLSGQQFALVTTSRPDPDLAWPPPAGPYSVLRLRLDPLDQMASTTLARSILGDAADPGLVTRLFEHSGGNPLFLEELATMVSDRGGGGATIDLPDSLRTLIAARLDRLPPAQRSLIDNAAVLGSAGSFGQLVKFGQAVGVPADAAALQALDDAGLLSTDGRRWQFRSESVREVAYQTLTKAVRAMRHVGVAAAMSSSTGSPEEIAHHLASAAELVLEVGRVDGVPRNIVERAAEQLAVAAERAVDQRYGRTAARLATRGLDLVDGIDDPGLASLQRRLLLARGDALTDLRRLDGARSDLEAVLAAATSDGDRTSEAAALATLGDVARIDGRFADARRDLDRALAVWRELGDDRAVSRTLRRRGFLEVFGGTPRQAAPFLDEADEISTQLDDRGGRAWVQQHRAWMSFLAGDIALAETQIHDAAQTLDEVGDEGGLAWAFGLLAYVRFFGGHREEAARLAAMVRTEAEARDDDWAAGMMQALQGSLALWDGRTVEAMQHSDAARARFRRLGDRHGELQALAPGVRAMVALGRASEARQVAEEVQASAKAYGQVAYAAMIEAEASIHGGRSLRAIDMATVVVDECEAERGGLGLVEALATRGLARAMEGDLEGARLDTERAMHELAGSPAIEAKASLVAALDRRPMDAIALAAGVPDHPATTYLDRVHVDLALAGAHRQLGDEGEARFHLDEAVMLAGSTGDVVTRSIVDAAQTRFGFAGNARHPSRANAPIGRWEYAVDQLANSGPVGVVAADRVEELR